MKNKIYYIIMLSLLVGSFSHKLNAQKAERIEELEFRVKTLEEDLKKSIGVIDDLELQIEEAEFYSKSLTDIIAITSKPTGPNYKEEYNAEQQINKKLNTKNQNLVKKQRELDAEIAKLRGLLRIEKEKVAKLKYQKAELELQIDEMDLQIDNLEYANKELRIDKRQLEKHVGKLQRDSVKKETKIAKQVETIQARDETITLKKAKISKLEEIKAENELTIGLQQTKIQLMHNESAIKRIHLQSVYLGVNYRVSNFFHPYERGDNVLKNYQSNVSFSLYTAPIGFYFSLPLSYNDKLNSFGSNEPQYYFIQDIESVKMQMDIKGGDYTDISYNSTKMNFDSYNLGIYWSPMRYTYLMLGATTIRGEMWDLYTGDFSQTEEFGVQSLVKTEDDFYVLNYTDLSIVKPTIGVGGLFPLRTHKQNRKPNKHISSPTVSKHNYNVGFQFELGYNWAYDNYFLNTGLHVKVKNINKEKSSIRRGKRRADKQIADAEGDYRRAISDKYDKGVSATVKGERLIESADTIDSDCIGMNTLCRGNKSLAKGRELKIKGLNRMIIAKENEVEGKTTLAKLAYQESVVLIIGEEIDEAKLKEKTGDEYMTEVNDLKEKLEELKLELITLEESPNAYTESDCYTKTILGVKKQRKCETSKTNKKRWKFLKFKK